MPRDSSRAGHPADLLTLLWSPQQAVGRTGVTLAAITAAAAALADAEGLSAVTMRRVAQSVDVGAMTLYTYVPGRPELLELMLDSMAAATYEGRRLPAECGDWRSGVDYLAQRNWEHALLHPWAVEIPPARPILGPGVTMKYECELAPLDGIGLSDHQMGQLLTSVLAMVTQAARWQSGLDRIRADSTLTDGEWWRLSEPALSRAVRRTDVPISSRVGESMASAGDPLAALRFGLTAILDGVQVLLDRC
ncbi:MAG: TetR/AcrR family transcriptional regulator [Nakamurella sp.]